jgi:hypothetical protein
MSMRITERTCPDCQSKFDLVKDKYFVKKPSKLVTIINVILRCIIFTTKVTIGDSKLICETCNRDNKIKKLLK